MDINVRRRVVSFRALFILLAIGLIFSRVEAGAAESPQGSSPAARTPVLDATAQDDEASSEDVSDDRAGALPFTVASIAGTYSSVNIGRGGVAPVSDVGIFKFDGAGRSSGFANVNLPVPGEDVKSRFIFHSTMTGAYSVDPNGTGATDTRFSLPDGTAGQRTSILVITKYMLRAGTKIATEFVLITNDLSWTTGNVDTVVLKRLPDGEFNNASLVGTFAFELIGRGGSSPLADVGLATFDGRGRSTVYSNQNIPGEFFGDREIRSRTFDVGYSVNPDGTGDGGAAYFVITEAKRQGEKLVATEVTLISKELDQETGSLQTTVSKRISPNPNPNAGGFTKNSISGQYAATVIGRGSQVPQSTAAVLAFDGSGQFSGKGMINLPGILYGERRFVEAPFVGTYTVKANGTGTTLDGGEAIFVITDTDRINGVKVATEFALLVKDLQPTGNLMTATFTRLPAAGVFSRASLRGRYALVNTGRAGQSPESGVGVATFDGGGRFVTEFIQNIPGQSYRERTLLRGTAESSYDVDATGMGTATITQGEEGVLLITKAKTVDRLKVAEQFVLIVRSLSERTRSLITTVGTRLSN